MTEEQSPEEFLATLSKRRRQHTAALTKTASSSSPSRANKNSPSASSASSSSKTSDTSSSSSSSQSSSPSSASATSPATPALTSGRPRTSSPPRSRSSSPQPSLGDESQRQGGSGGSGSRAKDKGGRGSRAKGKRVAWGGEIRREVNRADDDDDGGDGGDGNNEGDNDGSKVGVILKNMFADTAQDNFDDFQQLKTSGIPHDEVDYYKGGAIEAWKNVCTIVRKLNLPVNLKGKHSPARQAFIRSLDKWNIQSDIVNSVLRSPKPTQAPELQWDWEPLLQQVPAIRRLGLDLDKIEDYGDFVSVFLTFCQDFDEKVQHIKAMKPPRAGAGASASSSSSARAHAQTQARQLMKELNSFMIEIQNMLDFLPILTVRLLKRAPSFSDGPPDLDSSLDKDYVKANFTSLKKNWQRLLHRLFVLNDSKIAKDQTSQDFDVYLGLNYIRDEALAMGVQAVQEKLAKSAAAAGDPDINLQTSIDNFKERVDSLVDSLATKHMLQFLDESEYVDVFDEKEAATKHQSNAFEGMGWMFRDIQEKVSDAKSNQSSSGLSGGGGGGSGLSGGGSASASKSKFDMADQEKVIFAILDTKKLLNKVLNMQHVGLQYIIKVLINTALVRITSSCVIVQNLSEADLVAEFENIFQVLLKIYFTWPILNSLPPSRDAVMISQGDLDKKIPQEESEQTDQNQEVKTKEPDPSGGGGETQGGGEGAQPKGPQAPLPYNFRLIQPDTYFETLMNLVECMNRNVTNTPVSATLAEKTFFDLLFNFNLETSQGILTMLEMRTDSSKEGRALKKASEAVNIIFPLHKIESLHWFKELSFPSEAKSKDLSGKNGGVKSMLQKAGINNWEKYLILKGVQGPNSDGVAVDKKIPIAAKTDESQLDKMKLAMESSTAADLKKLNANLQLLIKKYATKVVPGSSSASKASQKTYYNFFLPPLKVYDCLSKLVGALGGADFFSLDYIQTWTVEDLLLLCGSLLDAIFVITTMDPNKEVNLSGAERVSVLTRRELYGPLILKFIDLLDAPNFICNICFYISFLIKRTKEICPSLILFMMPLVKHFLTKFWNEKIVLFMFLPVTSTFKNILKKSWKEEFMLVTKVCKLQAKQKAAEEAKEKKKQENTRSLRTTRSGSGGGESGEDEGEESTLPRDSQRDSDSFYFSPSFARGGGGAGGGSGGGSIFYPAFTGAQDLKASNTQQAPLPKPLAMGGGLSAAAGGSADPSADVTPSGEPSGKPNEDDEEEEE